MLEMIFERARVNSNKTEIESVVTPDVKLFTTTKGESVAQ